MPDIQTSIHGERCGLDARDNLVIKGSYIAGADSVETGSTAARLKYYGLSLFGAATAKTYILDDVPIGGQKELRCTQGSTGALQTVQTHSTAVNFGGNKRKLVFNAADDAVIIKRESATRYGVYSNVGSVAVSS